jgi:hypothetical protein
VKWLLLTLSLLMLAPSALAASAQPESEPAVQVSIVRDGDLWTADFTFGRDAAAWAFTRSALTRDGTRPWRPLSWTVETPGVQLKRIGFYDAFIATGATVPRKVRVRFKPFADDLRADYDPALAFTDGSVALFTEHYNAIPLASEKAVAALPSHLGGVDLADDDPAAVTFADRVGPVLHGGKRHASVTLTGADSYVLFGQAETSDAPSITTILDPQLPEWLAVEIANFTPKMLGYYAQQLGPRTGDKPMIMVSWAGPTPGLRSMGGSVLPGLILMRLEGEVVTRPTAAVSNSARWFIAHEASHLWLGQTIRYRSPAEAWITEGGADLLGIRSVSALDDSFDAKPELQKRLDECIALTAKGSISSAAERNEHNAYYACGAMFGLAAEAAAARTGGNFASFWRSLIAANRDDDVVTREEWLGELSRLTGGTRAAAAIVSILDAPSADASKPLEELFAASGVPHRRTADGKLELL